MPAEVDGARHAAHQAAVAKLHAGHVHRHLPGGAVGVAPAAHLRARLAQHPIADLDDQAALLREGDELVRRHEAALRMRPAQQRLDGLDLHILERQARLIIQREFLPLHRLAQIAPRATCRLAARVMMDFLKNSMPPSAPFARDAWPRRHC